jgi:hypothetical protein
MEVAPSVATPTYNLFLQNIYCACTVICAAGSLEVLFAVAPKHITMPDPAIGSTEAFHLSIKSEKRYDAKDDLSIIPGK